MKRNLAIICTQIMYWASILFPIIAFAPGLLFAFGGGK